MLGYLTLIFVCQLVGELVAVATGWPVPGPVIGMVLLSIIAIVGAGSRDRGARHPVVPAIREGAALGTRCGREHSRRVRDRGHLGGR